MKPKEYDVGYAEGYCVAMNMFTDKIKEKSFVFLAEYIISNHITYIDDATLLAMSHEINKELLRREP